MNEAIKWLKLYMDNHRIGKNVSQEYLDMVNVLIESCVTVQGENKQLKQQLKDKDEKISKIYEIKKDILTRYKLQDGNDKSREFYYMQCIDLILNILETNKED